MTKQATETGLPGGGGDSCFWGRNERAARSLAPRDSVSQFSTKGPRRKLWAALWLRLVA